MRRSTVVLIAVFLVLVTVFAVMFAYRAGVARGRLETSRTEAESLRMVDAILADQADTSAPGTIMSPERLPGSEIYDSAAQRLREAQAPQRRLYEDVNPTSMVNQYE
jgi:hypothetical protein